MRVPLARKLPFAAGLGLSLLLLMLRDGPIRSVEAFAPASCPRTSTAPAAGGPTGPAPTTALRMALDAPMVGRLDGIRRSYRALTERLGDPDVLEDARLLQKVMSDRARSEDVVAAYDEYTRLWEELCGARELFQEAGDDADLREMARAEVKALEPRLDELETEIKLLLLPKDPNDDRNVMVEIRAGTGGSEASIFAGDLLDVYRKYITSQGWQATIIDYSAGDTGGYKNVVMEVKGDRVYSKLKWEAGVHRVQRVPATESQGRVHTSTATVAIMPECDEVDVNIDPKDLDMSTTRSGGAGGQVSPPCHVAGVPSPSCRAFWTLCVCVCLCVCARICLASVWERQGRLTDPPHATPLPAFLGVSPVLVSVVVAVCRMLTKSKPPSTSCTSRRGSGSSARRSGRSSRTRSWP